MSDFSLSVSLDEKACAILSRFCDSIDSYFAVLQSPAGVKPLPAPVIPQMPAPAPIFPQMPAPAPVIPQMPPPAPVVQQMPAPQMSAPTAAPTYTMDQIAKAGAELAQANTLPQLQALLQRFNVQAITQLSPEQYAPFAMALRGLGAQL